MAHTPRPIREEEFWLSQHNQSLKSAPPPNLVAYILLCTHDRRTHDKPTLTRGLSVRSGTLRRRGGCGACGGTSSSTARWMNNRFLPDWELSAWHVRQSVHQESCLVRHELSHIRDIFGWQNAALHQWEEELASECRLALEQMAATAADDGRPRWWRHAVRRRTPCMPPAVPRSRHPCLCVPVFKPTVVPMQT